MHRFLDSKLGVPVAFLGCTWVFQNPWDSLDVKKQNQNVFKKPHSCCSKAKCLEEQWWLNYWSLLTWHLVLDFLGSPYPQANLHWDSSILQVLLSTMIHHVFKRKIQACSWVNICSKVQSTCLKLFLGSCSCSPKSKAGGNCKWPNFGGIRWLIATSDVSSFEMSNSVFLLWTFGKLMQDIVIYRTCSKMLNFYIYIYIYMFLYYHLS